VWRLPGDYIFICILSCPALGRCVSSCCIVMESHLLARCAKIGRLAFCASRTCSTAFFGVLPKCSDTRYGKASLHVPQKSLSRLSSSEPSGGSWQGDYKTCPLFLVFVISCLVSSSHHPPHPLHELINIACCFHTLLDLIKPAPVPWHNTNI
jgi:hypothetical protein